jgi:hypothetical protein
MDVTIGGKCADGRTGGHLLSRVGCDIPTVTVSASQLNA